MKNFSLAANNTAFSLKKAYIMALASKLAYESEKSITGIIEHQGLQSVFINNNQTDTQAFIAHNTNCIVIAFRGTKNFHDCIIDAGICKVNTTHGRVHAGFNRALDSVWDQIMQIVSTVKTHNQPIWITGHSLGAALAVLTAARLSYLINQPEQPQINGLYTFGQPRVGDAVFITALELFINERYFRLVNDNDIVTRIPDRFNQYQHGGILKFFDTKGILQDDISYWSEFLERIKGDLDQKIALIPSCIEHHSIDRYIKNLIKNVG